MPANTRTIARRYYPRLSEIVTVEDLPQFLSFVQDGLNSIFDKIHYKNLQYSKSLRGDSAFYSLDIVTKDVIGLTLPGDLKLVLNPDATDTSISSFPVMLEYQWEILGFLRSFDLQNFSFSLSDFYNIGLQVFRIDENQVVANTLNFFIVTPESGSKFQQLEADINEIFPDANFVLPPNPSVGTVVTAINGNVAFGSVPEVLFAVYINNPDITVTKANLQQFFAIMVPDGIEDYIKRLITPKAKASFELSAGLQFPREYLQPVYGPLGENPFGEANPSKALEVIAPTDANGNPLVTLRFGEATFYADTEKGLGYAMEFNITTNAYAQVANTGIIVYLNNLKLDLSKDTNIAEADADGRPADFIGVYAEELDIILPKKWFTSVQQNMTLAIVAKNLLIGTGGLSGTIALQTIDGGNAPGLQDILWFKIGSSDGFKIGFTAFDITFKQNKVVHSGLVAALEIKKFKYPKGHPLQDETVRIGVTGSIQEDGGFDLTGTVQDYPIRLPDVFTYNLKTLKLHVDSNDGSSYIGTSGTLQFEGFLKDLLNLKSIEIQSLRIYSDGSMEFDGGDINLASPIILPLGPVNITVAAIHYGSIQKEVDGKMRKFNYFGFDGGLKVDPFGIEVRGDGVKYYYCTDNIEPKAHSYLHIETIHIDVSFPMPDSVSTIKGWLSIPDPGVSQEYRGHVDFDVESLKMSGTADMKLMPKYPAFIIDAEITPTTPIPMGSFSIYSFKGLLGYRYVAEKEAVGLVSGKDSWYDYYKKAPKGISVDKFSGPDKTSKYKDPISIGAGATFGTSFDSGTVLNLNVMLLLSMPLFMLDGRAAVLSKRLKLEATKEPPFFAMAAIGDKSLELGFGADFKMPTNDGSILKLYADIQAAFYFNNSSKWFVNFGTKEKPTTATILSLVDLKSYLMLSARGIEAGARGDFDFKRKYAKIIKVHAWAYLGVGGHISFERPQFGAFLEAGIGADIDVKFVSLHASLDVLFSVEAAKPFLIYGKARIKIKIKILFVFKFSFNKEVEILWEKSKQIDRTPINPFTSVGNDIEVLKQLVKGVNMLSNETFDLAYLGDTIPGSLDPKILEKVIPIDTYIDFKTEKGLTVSGAVSSIIGGLTNAPSNYTDLIPPDKVVKGRELRQVKHKYSIESISIKSWSINANTWMDYHPYKALYPDDTTPEYNNLKIGQFQKADEKYNTIRLLATTPFSYTENGQPGWYIPEQYGLTPGTLFCATEELTLQCADFVSKPIRQVYYCTDQNQAILSNNAAFLLLDREEGNYAEVTNDTNVFMFPQSLAFDNTNKLQIMLPTPSVKVVLRLTNSTNGVRIKYYSSLINNKALEAVYGNPDPTALKQGEPFVKILGANELRSPIEYYHPAWRAVTRIVIEPIVNHRLMLNLALEELAVATNLNDQISLGLVPGVVRPTVALETKVINLRREDVPLRTESFAFNVNENIFRLCGNMGTWLTSWDTIRDQRPVGSTIGFEPVAEGVLIHSVRPISNVTLFPVNSFIEYQVINHGNTVLITGELYGLISPDSNSINIDITFQQVGDGDVTLCSLFDSLVDLYNYGLVDPATQPDINSMIGVADSFRYLLLDFDYRHPDYDLNLVYSDELDVVQQFITNPYYQSYANAYNAIYKALTQIGAEAACDSGLSGVAGYDVSLRKLYDQLNSIVCNKLKIPQNVAPSDVPELVQLVNRFAIEFTNFMQNNPTYAHLSDDYAGQINNIYTFLYQQDQTTYAVAYQSVLDILSGVDDNAECGCTDDNLCELSNALLAAFKPLPEPIYVEANQVVAGLDQFSSIITTFHYNNIGYDFPYKLRNQLLLLSNYNTSSTGTTYTLAYAAASSIVSYIVGLCDCNQSCHCDEHAGVCEQFTIFNHIVALLPKPQDIVGEIVPEAYDRVLRFYEALIHSGNDLLEKYADRILLVEQFLNEPNNSNYLVSYNAIMMITGDIKNEGNCLCVTDSVLEQLFNEISAIRDTGLTGLDQYTDINTVTSAINEILYLIILVNYKNPQYDLNGELSQYLGMLNQFLQNPDPKGYTDVLVAIQYILDYINALGGYTFITPKNRTLLHEVCWLSLESYEFNAFIPGIDAISADSKATIAGITKYVQPVWRPDTSYVINFEVKDYVDNDTKGHSYQYTYGFTTGGPVGYFHKNEKSTYGDKIIRKDETILLAANQDANHYTVTEPSILNDVNGILRYAGSNQVYPESVNSLLTAHPDNYPLTSLKQYIDYSRSYPNADGNLLMAKPLFYDDQTSQIYLFFIKAYAVHFFNNWAAYNGQGARNGRMKVVIKDPVEGTEIVNPPYLDYNEADVTTVHIPQTVETWQDDENPVIPFVISQWANLYNANDCIMVGAEPIKPASQYISIALKHLKPNKLYTAIVNNLYDLDNDAEFNNLSETVEVHKFVFKTSRYANFYEQVYSYKMTWVTDNGDALKRDAVFMVNVSLTPAQIEQAYKTIIGQSNPADDLITRYQHAYDRVFEGVFNFEAWHEPASTEFNILFNETDNSVSGIIIRNPEPFNIPKIPIGQIQDTICVMSAGGVDQNYKVLHSKDYSQVLVMNTYGSPIVASSLDIRFLFKIWDGTAYTEQNQYTLTINLIA